MGYQMHMEIYKNRVNLHEPTNKFIPDSKKSIIVKKKITKMQQLSQNVLIYIGIAYD